MPNVAQSAIHRRNLGHRISHQTLSVRRGIRRVHTARRSRRAHTLIRLRNLWELRANNSIRRLRSRINRNSTLNHAHTKSTGRHELQLFSGVTTHHNHTVALTRIQRGAGNLQISRERSIGHLLRAHMRGRQRRTHGTTIGGHFKDHHVIAQAALRHIPSAHANRLQLSRPAQLCSRDFQDRLAGLSGGTTIRAVMHQHTILSHLGRCRVIGRRFGRARGCARGGASRCTRRRTRRNALRCRRRLRRCRGDRRARAILRDTRGCAGAQGHLGGGVRLHLCGAGNAGGVREENVLAASHNLVDCYTVLGHKLNGDSLAVAQILNFHHVRLLNVEALVNTDLQRTLIVQRSSHLGGGHGHRRHGTIVNGNSDQANLQILQRGYAGQRQQGVVITLSNQVQGNVVADHIGGNGDGKFRLRSLLSLRVSGRGKGGGGQSCRRDGAAQTEGGRRY